MRVIEKELGDMRHSFENHFGSRFHFFLPKSLKPDPCTKYLDPPKHMTSKKYDVVREKILGTKKIKI